MSDAFSLVGLDAQDEVKFTIRHPKTDDPTTWEWTFYGPGHPTTIAVADKASRRIIKQSTEQMQAQVNGKKWKPDDETPDSLRQQNVENIIARTKSFTPVDLGHGPIEYSAEKAKEILLERRYGWVLGQIMDFLRKEENFIQPSARS